jgi:hypothetical protein
MDEVSSSSARLVRRMDMPASPLLYEMSLERFFLHRLLSAGLAVSVGLL